MTSIRRQLTRELLAAFLLLLGGALAALYFAARDELIEQFDDALRIKAAAISSLTLTDDGRVHLDMSDRLFRSFGRDDPQDYFEIWPADGTVAARSDSLRGADLSLADQVVFPRVRRMALPQGQPGRAVRMVFSPEQENGEHHDHRRAEQLTLIVASDSAPLEEALTELLSIGAVCGVLGLGATVWLVSRVLRRGLQPLALLGEQAARINADSLTTRFAVDNMPAELAPIAGRLNELLARLEISFERERRFSADLAHELRTPLAELRSLAECALKWPESRDRATDEEVLAAATQMQAIVTSLLALARADQQQLVANAVPVNVAALAAEVWQHHTASAGQRGVKMAWNVAPVTAAADPVLLRSILGNLFENAADYATPGTTIEVDLHSDGSQTRLRVANAVENLQAADVPKLFDRFWRKEEARSGGRHFGLGLSLARMFARAMGWTLIAELNPRGCLEFTLTGPVADDKWP
jgi:two-component system sensor histidine kinase QseC